MFKGAAPSSGAATLPNRALGEDVVSELQCTHCAGLQAQVQKLSKENARLKRAIAQMLDDSSWRLIKDSASQLISIIYFQIYMVFEFV